MSMTGSSLERFADMIKIAIGNAEREKTQLRKNQLEPMDYGSMEKLNGPGGEKQVSVQKSS